MDGGIPLGWGWDRGGGRELTGRKSPVKNSVLVASSVSHRLNEFNDRSGQEVGVEVKGLPFPFKVTNCQTLFSEGRHFAPD